MGLAEAALIGWQRIILLRRRSDWTARESGAPYWWKPGGKMIYKGRPDRVTGLINRIRTQM